MKSVSQRSQDGVKLFGTAGIQVPLVAVSVAPATAEPLTIGSVSDSGPRVVTTAVGREAITSDPTKFDVVTSLQFGRRCHKAVGRRCSRSRQAQITRAVVAAQPLVAVVGGELLPCADMGREGGDASPARSVPARRNVASSPPRGRGGLLTGIAGIVVRCQPERASNFSPCLLENVAAVTPHFGEVGG
jgi:hypothetical protein